MGGEEDLEGSYYLQTLSVSPQELDMIQNRISLQNVHYQVNEKTILDNLSIEITEKRIGIVGRNGSGKSSLAKLIGGLIKPTRGEITVNGIDVYADRKNAIKTVGMVFQNPDHQIIFPTVSQELSFGLNGIGYTKKTSHELALKVLANFGKSHWAEKPVSNLSEGQKHLVCLLSVLTMQPSVIILDEPFTGPDIPTVRILSRFLATLEQTILLISHDPLTLTDFDRVIWLEEGKVVLNDEPSVVLEEFKKEMYRIGDNDVEFEFSN